ncbi:MAG TPA: S8 family peptidase [Chthoniobacterales bacterium]|nr:S8 family peptidase [Chthoniobacterales bacterium]
MISNPKPLLSKLRLAATGMLLSAAAGMALYAANPASNGSSKSGNGVYIVQMKDAPAVAYKGGVAGHKATAPKKGEKIDQIAPDVVKYVGYLKGKHDAALAKVGHGQKLYSYGFTFNGFAAKLTPQQAAALAKEADVVAVNEDEALKLDTSSTPAFLGLSAPGGLWSQLGGVAKKNTGAGEGIVIGMVDSGIWPESKSFADRDASGKLLFQHVPGFKGKCDSDTDGSWNKQLCNQKLVAARRFNAGWGGDAGVAAELPWEFLSPRDYSGHGTHTASTAGGNHGVQATGPAAPFGQISGMAPRARIAAYKVCWETLDPLVGGCFTSDSVAAIDQAVADGVDVINFSISGTTNNFLSAVEVAFLNAADAGVFVATSAGNSGPTTGTVAHPSVWATTVAAGTHNRNGEGSVTTGDNVTHNGASYSNALASSPIIDSVNAGLPGADPTRVELCYSAADNLDGGGNSLGPVLDPAKVAGKIVVCKRGVTALVNKSGAVKAAGGVGSVIYNDPTNNTAVLAIVHPVPTVHVFTASGLAIKSYIASAGAAATASISQAVIVFNTPAPMTASFSSRGPSAAAAGDILKPDVMAPGQDILAAVAPPNNGGQDFAFYQGTSMSSPHVAGVAALLKQLHPNWGPMMIKSALMTTGTDVLDGGTPPPSTNTTLIFRQGAGHIAPNSAADPGLVYDAGINDWLAFLCGTTNGVNPATCTALTGAGYSFDPSDYNVASIAIGDMPGVQTVKRRVTNVGNSTATYTASFIGMTGITTTISPTSLTLAPGQTGNFTVTFTRTTAPLNTYQGGQLTWTDGTHNVRIPMVVRPVQFAAPASVFGNGAPISYNVKFGYTGPWSASARGLIPATQTAGTVADDPTNSFVAGGPGTVSFDFVMPAGTTHARFSLFDDFTDGNDDLDLVVVRVSTNTIVASSGGATSAEQANVLNPVAGETYRVWVHAFQTDGPDANFTLFSWLLGNTPAGNMTVSAPGSATIGTTGVVNLTFSGLAPATKYMGSVAYTGVTANPTVVNVDTP